MSSPQFLGTFIPLSSEIKKSSSSKEKDWYVAGYASTADLDLDGQIVDPKGIDYESYFKDHGWINYEHEKGIGSIVGEPTKVEETDKGLYLEGKLYKSVPKAQEIWTLHKSLQQEGSKRQLGFSVEGYITSKTLDGRITGMKLTNVSITSHPADTHATWHGIEKSATMGYDVNPATMGSAGSGDMSALRSEVAQALDVISYTMSKSQMSDILKEAETSLKSAGLLNTNDEILLLQLGRGLSRKEAQKFLNNMRGVQ